MELSLERIDHRIVKGDVPASRTIGKLYVEGTFQCYTLEDQVRLGPKVPGETAIPAGRYRVSITYSPRFRKPLPILHDVPGFEGVRIHAGNTSEDTEGCILVGMGRTTDSIVTSRVALGNLQHTIARALEAGDEVWITVS